MPIVLAGASSGSATLQSTDATTTTITLPSVTSTLYGNAGTTITSGTAQNSTSGTSIDFTGIPSWAKRVTVIFNGVSTSGSSNIRIQIGSGSITTSGYVSATWSANTINATNTGGFLTTAQKVTSSVFHGISTITLLGSNTYVESHTLGDSGGSNYTSVGGGNIPLSGSLDRVRITTVNGTDTFSAGSINILYE
jgi:uncharacterized protein YcnI